MEEITQDDFTEGWAEMSACCSKCRRIVTAKADRDRIDQFIEQFEDPDYRGGPYYAAIEVWTESPHCYRELMQSSICQMVEINWEFFIPNYLPEDYYCDRCFNPNYPEGIDDQYMFRAFMRAKIFAESLGGDWDWSYQGVTETQRRKRKLLWDQATERVYGKAEMPAGKIALVQKLLGE